MNLERIRELAASLASRIKAQDAPGKVEEAYAMALSREPNTEERQLGAAALAKLESEWPGHPEGALEAYCHALLNSAAFLYVD